MAKRKKSTRTGTGTTLTERAYETLRKAIIQGEFEEGSFLSGPDTLYPRLAFARCANGSKSAYCWKVSSPDWLR